MLLCGVKRLICYVALLWEHKKPRCHRRDGRHDRDKRFDKTHRLLVATGYAKALTSFDQFASVANASTTLHTPANMSSTSSGVSCASSQLGMTWT